jgi:hypothetical protein
MTRIPDPVLHLLDDLGQSQLAGDLTEELHAGRSQVWLWWQVSAAVLRGVASILRANPYLTFRAMALGWITIAVLNGLLPFSPRPEIGVWVHQSSAWMVLLAGQYTFAGWLVARLHTRHRVAMVIGATMCLTLLNAVTVASRIYFVWRFGEYLRVEMSPMTALSFAVSFCLPLMTMVGGILTSTRDPRPTAN